MARRPHAEHVAGAVGATDTSGGAHTVSGPRCTALGNGLWRCSFQVVTVGYSTLWLAVNTASASGSNSRANIGTAFGIGYVQVETGATPTSWISTTTAPVTRIADDLSLSAVALNLLNGMEATIAIRGQVSSLNESTILIGNNNNLRLAEISTSGQLVSGNGSTTITATTGAGIPSIGFGAAITHGLDSRKASLTTGIVSSDTNGWGTSSTTIRIGATTTVASGPLWLDSIDIWQLAASNSALISQSRLWV